MYLNKYVPFNEFERPNGIVTEPKCWISCEK